MVKELGYLALAIALAGMRRGGATSLDGSAAVSTGIPRTAEAASARQGDQACASLREERAEHVGDVIFGGGASVAGGITVTDLVSLPGF